MQKQPPGVFCKKAVLKNFARSTGKHLCWSLFLIQNIAKFLRPPILKNVWEQLLLKMCAGNWEKLKIVDKGFKLFIKKKKDFSTSVSGTSENVCLFVFISVVSLLVFFAVCFYIQCFSDVVRNEPLELIKIRSKVQEENISCERALNFDQWKTFAENYNPMRVWLWLVFKFT